ncbi:MAG: NYN domain-containing protein [Anaerolineae bacterium]|jgi:predicted RNA-binding protein with PIN domain|nr:NYN domain-containing protein [Anaerolineae bacterium]MDH7474790.1 NYN domain-containing protein [Anaerolineae bacterium]
MLLLIDGHNLIAKLPGISLDDPHDEARLVERLRRYRAHTGKRIVVVFDCGVPAGWSADLSGGGITVIFAAPGKPADRIIIERIRRSRNPRDLAVISSDREVMAVAEEYGARVIPADSFVATLSTPPPTIEERAELKLSPIEVEEWLHIFGADEE